MGGVSGAVARVEENTPQELEVIFAVPAAAADHAALPAVGAGIEVVLVLVLVVVVVVGSEEPAVAAATAVGGKPVTKPCFVGDNSGGIASVAPCAAVHRQVHRRDTTCCCRCRCCRRRREIGES